MERDGQPRQSQRDDAARYTPLLRDSQEPRWRRLRERLKQEEMAEGDVAVGMLFPDDVKLFFVIVAARDGRAFRFDFYWGNRGDEGQADRSPEDAEIRNWKELSDEERRRYAGGVRAALEYLENEA